MKKSALFIGIMAIFAQIPSHAQQQATTDNGLKSMTIFDHVIFYDGYNETVFDAEAEDGILRHRNSLYSIKLSEEQLNFFGPTVMMDITVGARCDNYDRIGNINLALVPKGSTTYDPFEVQRIELGRFITPFFQKQLKPREVPYTYRLDNICNIMHDSTLRENYDIYIEFELFGIPYAAWEQVKGCESGVSNDVFDGTLVFRSNSEQAPENSDNEVLVPIVMKKPEYIGHNLNNYSDQGTDEIGNCIKSYKFVVPENVESSHIVIISSNHGAGENGEEYERRLHFIYIDDILVATYTPGGKSCEPFRKYNTQPNGIYGSSAKPDDWWASWNNWCPGDVIPVRFFTPGPLTAGEHKLTISVPDAVFYNKSGDFPISAYYQGLKIGQITEIEEVSMDESDNATINIVKCENKVIINSESNIERVAIYSYSGELIQNYNYDRREIDISQLQSGAYLISVFAHNGQILTKKIIK